MIHYALYTESNKVSQFMTESLKDSVRRCYVLKEYGDPNERRPVCNNDIMLLLCNSIYFLQQCQTTVQ